MVMVIMAGTLCFSAPPYISYQGVLKDSAGLLINGTRDVTFRICSADLGGTVLWEETQTVSIESGLYSVKLGSVTPMTFSTIFDDDPRYLAVLVVGAVSEILPRTRIMTVPYAYRAETVAYAGSAGSSNMVLLAPPAAQTTSLPNAIWIRSTSGAQAVSIESTAGTAVSGIAKGTSAGNGGYFESNTIGGDFTAYGNNGKGIYAAATQTGDYANYGGNFLAMGQRGAGIWGYASNTTGQNYGGYFTALGDQGTGVYGSGPAEGGSFESTSGPAVYAGSTGGVGVYSTSNNNTAVYGKSVNAAGVHGYCTSTGGHGVYGNSSAGYGVAGYSSAGNAVYGQTATGYAVRGVATTANGYSGYFGGGLGIKVDPTLEAQSLVINTLFTPANSSDGKGKVGTIAWDDGFLYVKTAAGAWKRVVTVIGW